jgi:hypothetical protein
MVGVITVPFQNDFGRAPAKKQGRAIRFNRFLPLSHKGSGFPLLSLTRIAVHWKLFAPLLASCEQSQLLPLASI